MRDATETPLRPYRADGGRGVLVAFHGTRAAPHTANMPSSFARAVAVIGVGPVALAGLDSRVMHALGSDGADAARSPSSAGVPSDTARVNGVRDAARVHRSRRLSAELAVRLVPRGDGVWVMAAPRPRRPALSDAKSVADALEVLRATVSVGVLDLERQVNERTLAALDASDRVLLVASGSVTSLRATQRMLRLCRRLNYPDEKLCVVVSSADAPGALDTADIPAALKREVYWTMSSGERDYAGLATRVLAELDEGFAR